MFLDGFGIAGYRSFGPEMVLIPNLSKINIFIGKKILVNRISSDFVNTCHIFILM